MERIRKEQPRRESSLASIGKVRSPAWLVVLTIFTVFIYSTYWGYVANKELKDHCPDPSIKPVLFAVMFSPLGFALLLIPSWIALYYMAKALRNSQIQCGCEEVIDPAQEIAAPITIAGSIFVLGMLFFPIAAIGLLIGIVYFFVFLAKVQHYLNLHWQMHQGEIRSVEEKAKENWVMNSQSWVAHCDLPEQESALNKFIEKHQMMVMRRKSDDRSLELRLLQGSPIRTQFLGGLLARPEQLYKRASIKLEVNEQCVEVDASIEDDFGFWALPSPVRKKYEGYFDWWMVDLKKSVA